MDKITRIKYEFGQIDSLDRNKVKRFLGDSTNNNRVLTVNQVVRFLAAQNFQDKNILLQNILVVYNHIKNDIKATRGNRTDAIDFTEFFTMFREYSFNRRFVKEMSNKLL